MSATLARRVFGACLLSLLGPLSAVAQEASWAEKMFDETRHDFGDVARGSETVHRIRFTNKYKETVHVSNVRTTCGCTAAKPSKTSLASREEAYIEIQMDTRKFSRKKESNVIVTFDAPLAAEVRIPISVYIRTDVVLEPGGANFGAVDLGSSPTRKINIAYAGRPDWTIRGVRSTSGEVTTNLVETSRAGGRVTYDLEVALKPTLPAGDFRSQIFLQTDDAESPQVPVLVEARVEADITVTPEVIAIGPVAAGQSKMVNVVIKGKKPFAVEKLECDSELEAFKVRLPKDTRPVQVLPLTFVAPAKPGSFTETFTLTIADRPQPVTFKAYGTIVEAGSK